MQKKTGIRALALVLALVMVMGLIPAAKAAPVQSETQGFKTIAEYLEEQTHNIQSSHVHRNIPIPHTFTHIYRHICKRHPVSFTYPSFIYPRCHLHCHTLH